jgi:hypothetical protein
MKFIAERESGSDWCIAEYIGGRRYVRASGLDMEEAEETARQWNENDQREKSKYV